MSLKILTFLLGLSLILNAILIVVLVKEDKSVYRSESQVAYAMTGYEGDPESDLINVIKNAEKELNIAIYNLDNKDIMKAIVEASERGVDIKMITDAEKAGKKDSQQLLTELKKHHIPIKVDGEKKMHMKMTISDNKTVVTGSFNYTNNSAHNNQEILLTVNNPELASSMNTKFDELWDSRIMKDW